MEEYLSITEVAKLRNVSRGAIFAAIKKGRLKAELFEGVWRVKREDIEKYEKSLFIREESSRYNGKHMYEEGKTYSLKQLANATGLLRQQIYHLARTGAIKTEKQGSQHIVTKETYDQFVALHSKTKTA